MQQKHDNSADDLLYRPNKTSACSEPLFRFILEYDNIISLFFSIVRIATRLDETRSIAAKAIAKAEGKRLAETQVSIRDAFNMVFRHGDQLSRNMVVGMANNFSSYLSETLQLVMIKKPEILRSSEKISTEEVLQFGRVDDLIAYIADRKIAELAYAGLRGLESFLKERLGVDLFETAEERYLLTVLIELRNVHTHNRGHINEIFLKRVGGATNTSFKFTHGDCYHVDLDDFAVLSRNAIHIALRLDAVLSKKFRIKRTKYVKRLEAEKLKPSFRRPPDSAAE
jgi:hypothetical protein